MKVKALLILVLLMVLMIPIGAAAKKKKGFERGMLEKMDAVPCGAKQQGITGLGSVFASVGVQHVNSDEKLCPEYLLRTDEVEYHIRPMDGKHPVILPIGHEGEFKVSKDRLYLRVPDGDRKTRAYRVVSIKPSNSENERVKSADKTPEPPQ